MMWTQQSWCSWHLQPLSLASLLATFMLLPVLATASQNSSQQELAISLSVQPSIVRRGQEAVVSVRLRNPRQNETITLVASATYTDDAGVQRQVQSNPVQLTIDASLPIRIEIPADKVRLVAGTALFDGMPVTATSNSAIAVDVVVPGDGQEHTLQLRVIR